jgi:hypothetical protein
VQLTFTAAAAVTAMQMVVAVTSTTAKPANSNTTFTNATALGIALTSASIGGTFTALLFGTVADASFSSFALNQPIYLDTTGFLTETAPTTGFQVTCGKYFGNNTILINVSEPIAL